MNFDEYERKGLKIHSCIESLLRTSGVPGLEISGFNAKENISKFRGLLRYPSPFIRFFLTFIYSGKKEGKLIKRSACPLYSEPL